MIALTTEYGLTYPEDNITFYYWAENFWKKKGSNIITPKCTANFNELVTSQEIREPQGV